MGVRKGILDKRISAADPEDHKASVRAVTTAPLAAYTRVGNVITADANGALDPAAQDDVTLVADDSLLLTTGASGSDNGIYVVTQPGSIGTPFILTRRDDADTDEFVNSGMRCTIEEGALFGGEGIEFVLVTPNPIVLNTTALDFEEAGGGGGGVPRNVTWWEGSNADGSFNGGISVHIEEDFSAQLNRLHLFLTDGEDDFTATLPAVTEDDENKEVAFFGLNERGYLNVVSTGGVDILLSPEEGADTVKINGGGLYVFRWEASTAKWREMANAGAMSRPHLLRRLDHYVYNVQLDLPDPQANDYVFADLGFINASYVLIGTVATPFAKVTGISTALRGLPFFTPRKVIYNAASTPVLFVANSLDSDANSRFSAPTDCVLYPGEALEIVSKSQNDDVAGWSMQKLNSLPLKVYESAYGVDATIVPRNEEMVLLSGGNATIQPAANYIGQRFGVVCCGNTCTIDAGATQIQNPDTREVTTDPFVLGSTAFAGSWIWDGNAWRVETSFSDAGETGAEIRHKAETVTLPVLVVSGAGPHNNVSLSGMEGEALLSVAPDVPFSELTGIDAASQADPSFAPRRTLYNFGTKPLAVMTNDVRSSAGNRFDTADSETRLILQPGKHLVLQRGATTGWLVLRPQCQALEVRRAVQTAHVTTPATDGERILVDVSGAPFAVDTPPQVFVGQRFGVSLRDGTSTDLSISAPTGGGLIQDFSGVLQNGFTWPVGAVSAEWVLSGSNWYMTSKVA